MLFHAYGLFVGLGIVLGIWVSEKIGKLLEKKSSIYSEISMELISGWIFFPTIIFARIYHVVDYWEYYKLDLIRIFYVWEGGLAIYGAIGGGLIGLVFFTIFNKKKLDFLLATLDLTAFGLPLAQAVGRMGNFVNKELYGLPTKLPWGLFIPRENRLPGFEDNSYFHPLFFYEALLLIGLFGGLRLLIKIENKFLGFYFSIYIIGYGIIRFLLDFLRIDPWEIGGLTVAQWISLGFIALGLLINFVFRLKRG
jgi:phosphatidylglycerol:prolipoprotein diacylglycerol transferase